MKYSVTPTEELRDLLIDKLFENPNDIVVEDTIDYITNTQKEINRLQQENKHLKEQLEILLEDNNQLEEIRIKAIEYIKITIKIIKEQPSSCELNDIWTLEHLNSFLEILGEK